MFAYMASQRWLVVDRRNWAGGPLEQFDSLADMLVDRLFRALDEADDRS